MSQSVRQPRGVPFRPDRSPARSRRRAAGARRRPRPVRIWAPVSLLWLLTPLFLLIFPFVAVICWAHRVDPFALAGHLVGLLASLPGTEVAVQDRDTNFRIKIV